MLCRLMSLLVYKYGLYPAFEKAGISPDFVLKKKGARIERGMCRSILFSGAATLNFLSESQDI